MGVKGLREPRILAKSYIDFCAAGFAPNALSFTWTHHCVVTHVCDMLSSLAAVCAVTDRPAEQSGRAISAVGNDVGAMMHVVKASVDGLELRFAAKML